MCEIAGSRLKRKILREFAETLCFWPPGARDTAKRILTIVLLLQDGTSGNSYCEDDTLTESGEYLLSFIKKWLKDNVIEVEWEGEKARLWTPWTK